LFRTVALGLMAFWPIGLDHAGGEIDLSNAVIPDVADEQLATRIHSNAARLQNRGDRVGIMTGSYPDL
jgi:hypothetical protein